MPETGFIGDAYAQESITQDGQDLVNWYCEVSERKGQGQRGVIALYPTPGFIARAFFGSPVEIRGLWVRPGDQTMYVVAGADLWEIGTSFTGAIVGVLLTATGAVSMTDNGTSLYLSDGPNRYYYTWGTATFAGIADGAFTGASRVDVVDNFIIYSQPNGNLWSATDLGLVTTNALSFGRKDSAPDNIVTLIANKREVFILGERTSEVWVDAGLFPFPFQKLVGTNMQHGCAAPLSLARLGESFAFLSRDDRGKNVVVMMNGYTPVRISTFAIENTFAQFSTVADAIGLSYQQNGHEFYMLSFPTADQTWVYDLATQMWHRRARRDNAGVLHRDRANCIAFFNGETIVGDNSNGIIYAASLTTFFDYVDPEFSGNVIPRIRTCRHYTSDLNRVFHHSIQLQFQQGVGNTVAPGDDPQAMLQWSDDGGFTWSNVHQAGIGKVGQYKYRTIWRRLGYARDRLYKLTVTDPVFPALISDELKTSAGAT